MATSRYGDQSSGRSVAPGRQRGRFRAAMTGFGRPAVQPAGGTEDLAVFAVTRLRVPAAEAEAVAAAVRELLAALGRQSGFRGGEVGRAAEDPGLWAMVTRWDGVGAYRRGLGAGAVKIAGAPVWIHAVDEPGVFLDDGEAGTATAGGRGGS